MRLLSRRVWLCVFVGVVLVGAWTSTVIARQRASVALATTANAFLASLTADQRQKAVFPLVSDEWTRWHFIPASMFPRNGLPLKDMTDVQRQRAHDLLKVSLSQSGYQTATAIIALENVLRVVEGQGGTGPVRDPELYYFSVFGDPSTKAGWGLRVEGHHVSLRFAVENGKMAVTSTPQFLGSNPAEVIQGPQAGLRVLGAQEDAARLLLAALDSKQQAVAIVRATAPGDIVTSTTLKVDPLAPAGLVASEMTAAQRDLLLKTIDVYAGVMPAEVAAARLAKIKGAGIEKITFAWAGPTEKGARYHYQIQGPTFVIEHNNTQGNGTHVHSVWRDFNGDFGRDLLAEHMAATPH